MLNRSKRLHLTSFILSSIILILVLVLGYFQYSSYKSDQKEIENSHNLIIHISSLLSDYESLENLLRASNEETYQTVLARYLQSSRSIQETLSSISSSSKKYAFEEEGLDSLRSLNDKYMDLYQLLFVQKFQSGGEDTLDNLHPQLADSGLLFFLTDWNKKEGEALRMKLASAKEARLLYFYLSVGLVLVLLISNFIYHKVIQEEFKTCDEAISQNNINNEIFEHAEQLAGLGHGVLDLNAKKVKFSSNLYRIIGLEQGEKASFRKYLKHIHPEDRRELVSQLKSLSLTKKSTDFDARIITSSGEHMHIRMLGFLKIENGERMVIFVNKDLTDEIRTELLLKELNQSLLLQLKLFRHVEKIASIGYFSYEVDTQNSSFSDNLFRLMGFSPGSFIGSKQVFLNYIHPEDRTSVSQWFELDVEQGDLMDKPVRLITCYGEEKFISFSREFFEDFENRILLITMKDVTQDAVVQRTLKNQNEELFRSNAELASFNHIASHDLQEPLRKIQTFISMLKTMDELKLSPKGYDFFERIQRSANRMQLLILDLLKFSRVSKAGKIFEDYPLDKSLSIAMEDLTLVIEEKKAIISVAELPTAKVIPFQMHQLFKNLLSNALKFSNTSEQIKIGVREEDVSGQDLIYFPNYSKDQLIKVAVEDNGIGFEDAHSESIFVIFTRLHDKFDYQGSGIGLAICKKIMENHNGIIYAESIQGKGSKFSFILPRFQNGN